MYVVLLMAKQRDCSHHQLKTCKHSVSCTRHAAATALEHAIDKITQILNTGKANAKVQPILVKTDRVKMV